jgi:hypothetical protein
MSSKLSDSNTSVSTATTVASDNSSIDDKSQRRNSSSPKQTKTALALASLFAE